MVITITTETTEQLMITAKFGSLSLFLTFIVKLMFNGVDSAKYSDLITTV